MEIDTNVITQYDFVSPDGNLYADTRLEEYIEYYNRIEEKIITKDEYNALKVRFGNALGFYKEAMVNRRKSFCLQHLDFLKNHFMSECRRDRSDEEWLDRLTCQKILMNFYNYSLNCVE